MRNWIEVTKSRERRFPTSGLKCCPLCGVLNAVQNASCFVCSWHGAFDHDPELIEAALVELLSRCPELADALDEPSPPVQAPISWWRRLGRSFGLWLHGGLDLRV